jgi:DNA-binding PadR family transcriptional regulator
MVRAEALKGHLDGLLLAALESEPEPVHGWALMARLREASGGELDLEGGTVYPVLRRLEESGLIDSQWTTAPGRRRRLYALTVKGSRALAEERTAWSRFVAVVGDVIVPAPSAEPTSS